MKDTSKNKFSEWLEALQQESWQLELLISGFVIFLLAGVFQPIANLELRIQILASQDFSYQKLYFPFYVLMGTWFILMINLSTHVFLRALWIGAIGLRYVSGNIDIQSLRYNKKFERFIKDEVGSFDTYIERLERLCSTIFAYTFLIIFIVLSIALFLALGQLLSVLEIGLLSRDYFILNGVYIIGGIFYLIDFISLGSLKRNAKFSRFYFPVYRFYGWITLAPVYRPLYYNLIDNRYGRMVLWSIIPYFLGIALYLGLNIRTEAYLPEDLFHHSLNTTFYEDTWDPMIPSVRASIASKYVDRGFIPLFLPYIPRNDDRVIGSICPDLIPAKTGIRLFSFDPSREEMNAEKALECSSKRFKIFVNDSLMTKLKYRFYEHPIRKRTGLITMLDVDYLPRGEHNIGIQVQLFLRTATSDSLQFFQTADIPFWKE